MKRTVPAAALLAALATLGVAGCGGSDKKSDSTAAQPAPAPAPTSTSGSGNKGGNKGNAKAPASKGGGSSLAIAADSSGQLKFDKSSLSAKAGKVTITMDNPSPVPHAIAVEGSGVDKHGKTVQMGGKSVVTVKLKPGKYTFYCPVDGHKQAGMEGPLTVK